MKTSIVIVDDHLLIAKALTEIIMRLNDYEVLYEAGNGAELIEKFKNKKNIPQIVLLDVSMPVMDGFETAAWLRDNHPEILIMALSMQDDEQSIVKMVKNGASGYLLKNISPTELDKALKALLTRGFYYPDWATGRILKNISEKGRPSDTLVHFTDKELEFFQYLCTEMSYKEIADKMYCSPRTVEGYRNTLFEKLNIRTRVGLAVYALRHGLCK